MSYPPKDVWKPLKLGYVRIYHIIHNLCYVRHGCSHIDLRDVVDIQFHDLTYPKRRQVTLIVRGRPKPLITLMRRGEANMILKKWMREHGN